MWLQSDDAAARAPKTRPDISIFKTGSGVRRACTGDTHTSNEKTPLELRGCGPWHACVHAWKA